MERARAFRWNTELFLKLDPQMRSEIRELIELTEVLEQELPALNQERLERLRRLDESFRKASFTLAQEEARIDLPRHPSPKLTQLNYLFTGWSRGLLECAPLEAFLREYDLEIQKTLKELEAATNSAGPRESEAETKAIEDSLMLLGALRELVGHLRRQLPQGSASCAPKVAELLSTGERLGQAFQELESCSPIKEPCPFCGGQISLSGRCRSCTRRLPHLEQIETGESEPESTFITNNCRRVDLALLRWERDPENLELWQEFQRSVREFAGSVTEGHKQAEMLAMAQDRPIDSQSDLRQKEDVLKQIGESFQAALSTLAKFSDSSLPPAETLSDDWREPLRQAEDRLRELQTALEPKEGES